MDGISKIPWWEWIPLPWRSWRIVLRVQAADEVPDQLPKAGVVLVEPATAPTWLVFDCPCNRGHRVMLNLDSHRKPRWSITNFQPLTLLPSINDRSLNSQCHYFIRGGRIQWVSND